MFAVTAMSGRALAGGLHPLRRQRFAFATLGSRYASSWRR